MPELGALAAVLGGIVVEKKMSALARASSGCSGVKRGKLIKELDSAQ